MQTATGNIWLARRKQDWVVIATNGTLRKDKACVMGRGIAKEAATFYPWLPKALGQCIRNNGLQVEVFEPCKLIIFPVKFNFWEGASLSLIETSTQQLVKKIEQLGILKNTDGNILMPRVGCGYGGRGWAEVAPILARHLISERYIIFDNRVQEKEIKLHTPEEMADAGNVFWDRFLNE